MKRLINFIILAISTFAIFSIIYYFGALIAGSKTDREVFVLMYIFSLVLPLGPILDPSYEEVYGKKIIGEDFLKA